MAPIRRYLRITKYSVLECRIYAEYPSASEAWLLGSNDPALPRIIEAIRPNVLPKLREENERASKGKSKKKSIKDVVAQDDFEVSYYFLDTSTRHSILTKHKHFSDKPRIKSNSGKLTGWLSAGGADKPVEILDEDADIPVLREEVDEPINLDDIPELPQAEQLEGEGNGDDFLFVQDSDEEETASHSQESAEASHMRRSQWQKESQAMDTRPSEDKKKLALRTYYDGFSIYGRILCLVVRRRGGRISAATTSSQQLMENWISTQAAEEAMMNDD